MKKVLTWAAFSLLLLCVATTAGSCSRKSGCPAQENATVKPNRKGNMSTRGGSSQLFPKEMRSKKKKSRKRS